MERLSRYIDRQKTTASAFAAKIGVAPSTIIRLLNGERDCGLKLAMKIEAGTNGNVKASQIVAERLRRGAAA